VNCTDRNTRTDQAGVASDRDADPLVEVARRCHGACGEAAGALACRLALLDMPKGIDARMGREWRPWPAGSMSNPKARTRFARVSEFSECLW